MLYNLKRCYTATIGTGTLTIGAAILNDFSDIPDGTTVSYSIMQGSLSAGFDAEVGRGTYSAGTLARDTVLSSTNGGAKIALDGTAQVVVTALAEDFVSFSGGVVGQVAAWSSTDTITAGALIPPASNILTLTNAAASTLALNITAGKTLTLTAADNYTLTVPATGTAALLATANVFTATQQITVPTTTSHGLILKTSDDNATKDLLQTVDSTGTVTTLINEKGLIHIGGDVSGFETYNLTVKGSLGGILLWRNLTNAPFILLRNDTAGSGFQLRGETGGGLNITDSGGGVAWMQVRDASLSIFSRSTSTAAIVEAFKLTSSISTSATGGANGFGVGQTFYAETATDGTNQLQARIASSWVDATNATRKAKLILSAYDTAIRTGLEIEASGTAAKIGFFGGTTAIQQVLAAYTSDGEGAAYTGIDNAQAGTVYATVVDLNQLRVAYETLRASYDDLRTKLLTSTLVA